MSWTIHGETYVSLEDISEVCHVEITWVQQVYELGILGPGEHIESVTVVPASFLDRAVRVRRITLQTGLDLDAAVVLFNV